MRPDRLLFAASIAALLALPALAQEAEPTPDDAPAAEADAEQQAADQALAADEIPTSRDQVAVGEAYQRGVFSDWIIRCVKVEQRDDICEMHQPLEDTGGIRTAEVNLFPLRQGEVAAAGTIVTPLETLLTQGIRIAVDTAEAKLYPFTFCSRGGCVAQVGFTEPELNAFKRGAVAEITIVPLVAPDRTVDLSLSLSGFTAAFEDLEARAAPN